VIGIVIVAHGRLAAEYRAAMEHVVGPQDGVRTIAIGAEDDRSLKQSEMFGGSPSNLSIKACNPQNRRIMYGANLPMLIKLAKSRHRPVSEAVDASLTAAHKYINSMSVGTT
jgi:PTS system mannose-specific IIA component